MLKKLFSVNYINRSMWCFCSAFQKRGFSLLHEIRTEVKRLGKTYEPDDSDFFVAVLTTVQSLQELDKSLEDEATKQKLVSLFKKRWQRIISFLDFKHMCSIFWLINFSWYSGNEVLLLSYK